MLNKFFHPKSIALIGASNNPKKIGAQILANLKKTGFRGRIYPVNLGEKKVDGMRAYENVKDIKGHVDLAVIAIPAKAVVTELKNCALRGIRNVVIISAGFSEIGGVGKVYEAEIRKIADIYNMKILGPNCLGMISASSKVNATFARPEIRRGNVAFISQSGAIGSAFLDWAQDKNIGVSHFASLGNETVLSQNDFLEYFINDSETHLVVAYLEEIKNGRRFLEVATRLVQKKPLIILKAGTSKIGRRAAMSHTGSIAGALEATESALRRSGAIFVDDIEDAFSLLQIFEVREKIQGEELFVISNAGGIMVSFLDQVEKHGLTLGKLEAVTRKRLDKNLPLLTKAKNPLDILGDADADRYFKAIDIMLRDRNVKNLIILLSPQTSTEPEETASAIGGLSGKYKQKLVITSFVGGKSLIEAKEILADYNVLQFDFPHRFVEVLGRYFDYQKNHKAVREYHDVARKSDLKPRQELLDYIDSFRLLEKYDISTVKTRKIETPSDLSSFQYPIAIKAVGAQLLHKTDQSSVALEIINRQQALATIKIFHKFTRNPENYCVAQEMEEGFEMILGFKRDKSFGPIIMVGAGGIYTEILQDFALSIDDLRYSDALAMVKSLRVYPILAGARGKKGFDIPALARAIQKLTVLATENPDIQELDINPLFIKRRGVKAVDVRIIV